MCKENTLTILVVWKLQDAFYTIMKTARDCASNVPVQERE